MQQYPTYGQVLEASDVTDGRNTRGALDHHKNNIETHLHEAAQLLRAALVELDQAQEMQMMLNKECAAVQDSTRTRLTFVQGKAKDVSTAADSLAKALK